MMIFVPRDPHATLEQMGFIPGFLDETDPRHACEQIDERYNYGGGWEPWPGFTMIEGERLKYPGDPPLAPICELRMRDERIVLYPASIVAIIQPDGSFEVCRLD
jgi:hypothetical protein